MGLQYQVYSNENVYCDLCEAIKVSVVVAVYNAEKYLEKCLNSLINQSLKDIEIICVNDCSIDDSSSVLMQYSKKDSRIRVLNMSLNSGAAVARNRGIDSAKGKYIVIVDADDYLEDIALENLYFKSENNQSDMCFFKVNIHNCTGEEVAPGIMGCYEGVYNGKELLAIFSDKREFFLYPWSVMYRRDFLNNWGLRYKPIRVGEGGDMNARAVYRAKRVVVDDGKYYHYCVNSESVTHEKNSKLQLLIGQLHQYSGMLKLFANDVDSRELYKYLENIRKKFEGVIKNLSIEQKSMVEENLEDEFSKYIFRTCIKDNLYIEEFTEDELKIIKSAEKIMLYGAGNASADVIKLLNKHSIEIEGFIVSDRFKNPKALFGHHVYDVTETDDFDKNMLIIVTTNKRYQDTIKKQLLELGFKKFLFLNIQI